MHGCGNDCAGHSHALGNVPLHLRAQHELGLKFRDPGFNLQIVVTDQRLDAIQFGCLAHLARELAAVGAEADHRETKLLCRHTSGCHGVRRIAEHKHAFSGQVSRVHRARVPR